MNSTVHGKRNTARPASVSSLAPRFTGSTLKGKKSRAALALVVSLWIATGGVASAKCEIDWENGSQLVSSPPLSEGLQGTVTDNKCLSVGVVPDFSGSSVTMPDTLDACYIANENVYSSTTGDTSVYGYTVNLTGKKDVSFNELTSIYGAGLDQSNSTYSVTNNSVNLQNVAFATSDQIEVFGGYTSGTGAASNNTVAISGTSFSARAYIYGARSENGGASGNTVTIANSNFNNKDGEIIGGYTNSAPNDNTLNLYGSVTGMASVQLKGGTNSGTGNELHLGGTKDDQTINGVAFAPWSDGVTGAEGNKVYLAHNFDKIVLHKVKWDTTTPVLQTTTTQGLGGFSAENFDATLDISKMTFDTETPSGTLTLLKSAKDNEFVYRQYYRDSALQLTYKDGNGTLHENQSLGDGAITVRSIVGGTLAPAAAPGVTLGYDSTHSVALANNNKEVQYSVTSTYKTATLGAMEWGKGYAFASGIPIDSGGLAVTFADGFAVDGAASKAAGSSFDLLDLTATSGALKTAVSKNVDVALSEAVTSALTINSTRTDTAAGEAGGKKVTYTTGSEKNVSSLVFDGAVAWSGEPHYDATGKGYIFTNSTAINATNLTFSGKANTALKTDGTSKMTLLSGVTGGENVLPANITQPSAGKGTIAVDYTNDQNINFTATASGEVSVGTDKVDYTINNVTLSGVNLANWNGTASAVPTGWTGSNVPVNTGSFSLPNETTTILTANTANFFGTVTGNRAYIIDSRTPFTRNGITISSYGVSGVKAEAYNGLANAKLTFYAPTNIATLVTIGGIEWNTSAPAWSDAKYTFNADTAIDASNLTFNGTAYTALKTDGTSKMTLLSGVTGGENVPATNITQPSEGKGTLAVDYTNDQNINFTATASGEVSVGTDKVDYTINNVTLSGVDLTGWNGTTGNVPEGWTAKSGGVSVTADSTFAPSITAGTPKNILTAATDNYFSNAQIADAIKYKADAESSDTANGVTLTGAESKGVKVSDDGKNLVYARSNFNVSEISLGDMTWGKERALSGGCDFNNVTDANISVTNLKFANPENIAKDATMTLLSGATNLKAGTDIAHTQDFTKTVNSTTLSATLSGNVTRTAETLGYTATGTTLNKATLGNFAWGAEADSLPEGWTASAATTIDATNFNYTGKADGNVAAGTTSMILNAPGLTEASPVTGGTNIEVAVEDTDDKGIKFEATATGHVEVEAMEQKVQYRVDSVTLKNVDLGRWNGENSGVPQDWTGSQVAVETGNFNVPTNLGAGQSIDILTTSKANFFGTVSGDRKYSSETFGNSEAGVTLSGNHIGGVKVEAYGEAANAKLTYYAETMDTTAIALGEMTWDTGRTAGTGYDFRNVGAVTATDLAFTFTDAQKAALSKDSQMTLLSGATNLAADKDITDKDKTQKIAYTVSNGAALNGTLTGEVFTVEGQVNYDATAMTLDSVNLANWNGTTDSVPTGWTSNLGANSITATGFTAPSIDAGSSKEILTTNTTSFFNDNQITGALKYKADAASSDTANGVTLSGAESKGVKASDDGKSLVYARSNFKVNNIAFGTMAWGTHRNASAAGYDYSNAAVNMDGLTFSNPADIAANSSTTLLTANNTLSAITETTTDISYGYSPVDGVTVNGIIHGSYKTDSNAIKYTATANNATKLTFGNVAWKDTGALMTRPSNITFTGAAVDTSNINFTNIKELEANKKMTLVKDFGTAVGMITGSKYKVGSNLQGEGHAFFENSNLLYLVTKGVDGKTDASGNTEEITGGKTVTKDVIGAATDSGKAESNKANVSGNSEVTGNVIGAETTSGQLDKNEANISGNSQINGDVTAGKTESGDAAANITKVENSMVTGNAVGAVTDTGVATGNEVNITGGSIGGDVAGATSDSGTVSQKNQASVVNATVVGNVYGGKSTSGEVNTNIANVSGGTVNGSVYGGMTNGENKSEGNEVKLESNTKVQKDVYGGYSQQGTATGNKVTIDDAAVDGTIYGGKSKNKSDNNSVELDNGTVGAIVGGGCEEASGNIVTITGGEVLNGVYGAKAGSSATNNTITMSGGKVNDVLYGGYADSATGITTGNTVTLYGTADVSNAGVFGGNGSDITGNVLNIGTIINDVAHSWSGGGQSVKNVANFETMNFVSVPWNKEKAAVTIFDGTASDLSATKVNATTVHFTDTTSLKQGDTMTLLDEQKVAVDKRVQAGNITKESEYTAGSTLKGTGILSMDDSGNVIYKVTDKDSSDQSHNTVMGATASMAALSAGNDFVGSAVEGLGNSNNAGSDGLSTYANLGGGSMNVETGSHVKTHTWNAILALGHKNEKKLSTTEYGAFFEYGTGNYSTFNGDERGDGSTRYTGGGILGKWKQNNGFYVEGSLRAGSIHDDANNVLRDANGNPHSYTTDATYWGAHIGVGREIKLNKTAVLDLYAKYFYNHRGSVSFDAGGHYDLGAVESSVLRVGTRYTVKQNDNIHYYGGLAVEHEFCGRASGFADGVAIRGADISGTSVRGEIGATFRPGEKSNVTLDLNLSGFAGKKQGITGGLSAVFHI